jgi:phosphatidylserine decarboxylase
MTEVPAPRSGDRRFVLLQQMLPKHLLSHFMYWFARSEARFIKRTTLRVFLRNYRIDMSEAAQSDPYAYRSFNDFFTRALRPDARPIAPDASAIVSPVDGTVSQYGTLQDEQLIQAKGHRYSLSELLADPAAAHTYRDGAFACIYLAPYNYHRIHMPLAGRACSNLYVPGELFSVNAATVRAAPRLFARNERLICEFDTAVGRMAVILVGALFVGSIATVHCGEVNPPPRGRKAPQPIAAGVGREFAKGAELGRFNMGSTVILLFQRDRMRWAPAMSVEAQVRMGSIIGHC